MDKDKFKHSRIEGRKHLLKKIIETFQTLHPVAIHQFGSGVGGFKDEFSDLDIWITFKDNEIEDAINKLSTVFKTVAPIVVRHHSKSWSPIDGSANAIIHETESGLFIVDYYISKYSETVIKENSVFLYGEDVSPRGEWVLNKDVNKNIHDSHILKRDIDLLLSLIFISSKGIVRGWKNDAFVNTLKSVHQDFRKRHRKMIKRRRISLNFKTDYRLLADLYAISNKSQKEANLKIRKYLQQVEELYT